AWLDFWQADGDGNYDNSGYKLRGHQYTDKNGRFILETVIPGIYSGRTAHIHLKVKASNTSPELTTQLFFPDSAQNQSDSIFKKELLVNISLGKNGKIASYNFTITKR
ncbi:MAG: intradiol ring-cleavage dioxygenase, partial [Candidatus Humimicrobiaceae bacterium]